MEQIRIEGRKVDIIEVDGFKFKDLNGNGKLDPYEDWRLPTNERIRDLISQMNSREKAGMLVLQEKKMGRSTLEGEATSHNGIVSEVEKEVLKPQPGYEYGTSKMIEDLAIRHIILRETEAPASEVTEWVNTLQEIAEETRLGIPVLILSNSRNELTEAQFDGETNPKAFTQFPGTLGMTATRNEELIQSFAEIGHKEFLHTNIRKGYMYMVDTATDPRWFRTSGTFGENPEDISKIAERIIPAYQGEGGQLNEESVALTIKHFPGGGARENGFDPHYEEGKFNVYPTEGSLEKYHLPPFAAAIKQNPSSMMPYYAIPSNDKSHTPQAPFEADFEEEIAFAYNKQFLTDLLRNQMGFKGYINSDTGVLDSCAWGAEDLTKPERVAKMLQAGTDIVSGSNEVEVFQEAIDQGLVAEADLNRALTNLFTEMFKLGLFENPYQDSERADEIVNTEESRAIAYQAHQEAVVLLKNKDNLLPLTSNKTEDKKIYVELLTKVYSEEEMMGRSRIEPASDMSEEIAKLRGQVRQAFPELDIVDDYKQADIAILFLEPVSGAYFEATEGYLDLQIHQDTNVDLNHIKEIRKHVDKLVIASRYDLPFIPENIEPLADAKLATFNSYIRATLDVILGKASAKGKLPLTLPANDAAVAVDSNGQCTSPNDVPGYDKEKYMDIPYVYTDSQGNRYEYGFGLTY